MENLKINLHFDSLIFDKLSFDTPSYGFCDSVVIYVARPYGLADVVGLGRSALNNPQKQESEQV
ncbi:MAG: hypothetical protein KIH03_09835 [Paludibacteraceae bacterium]|nr:hypothetical protein [Paludibacteraceae bacterium]